MFYGTDVISLFHILDNLLVSSHPLALFEIQFHFDRFLLKIQSHRELPSLSKDSGHIQNMHFMYVAHLIIAQIVLGVTGVLKKLD